MIFRRSERAPVVQARHAEPSLLLSADDDAAGPSERLLDVALAAVQAARTTHLDAVSSRLPEPPLYPSIWPGEHYRLLAGLVLTLTPRVVLDIGTFRGLSALALREHLPPGGRVASFDVAPWSVTDTALRDDDFADGRLSHHVADLSTRSDEFEELLGEAELVLVDISHDGDSETRMLQQFEGRLRTGAIVVFDDIRLMSMLSFWRGIDRPKLDLTSFGHWSGTGVVEWTKPL
jgi:predicted O-methyltransferase YrrM